MGLYFESIGYDFLLLFVVLDLLIVLYYFYSFNYWKRKGVFYLKPSFPFGNIKDVVTNKLCIGEHSKDLYFKMKRQGVKYGGFFSLFSPNFMPIDPDLIKRMMVKDFIHFQDRGIVYNEKDDPLSAHLFNLGGPKWRPLRTKLTPTFTSGKMKYMFQTLVSTGKILEESLDEIVSKAEPIDIKDIAARFTTDIISSVAFGLENSSLKEPDNEFRKYGKMVFTTGFFRKIKRILISLSPTITRFLKLKLNKVEVSEFIINVIRQTVEYRERNNIERNDMLNLLIKLKNGQHLDNENGVSKDSHNSLDSITFNELAAQCFVFFVAGYETSSSTMAFALFELSRHQDIQDKLRNEIKTVLAKHKGELTYEAVKEMTYMSQVVDGKLKKSLFKNF